MSVYLVISHGFGRSFGFTPQIQGFVIKKKKKTMIVIEEFLNCNILCNDKFRKLGAIEFF